MQVRLAEASLTFSHGEHLEILKTINDVLNTDYHLGNLVQFNTSAELIPDLRLKVLGTPQKLFKRGASHGEH